MAISLIGTGGCFTRLGAFAAAVNEVDTLRRTTTDTRLTTLQGQFATNEREDFAPIWSYRDAWRPAPSAWVQSLFAIASDYVTSQADRDTALPDRTLTAALTELIRQMRSSGDSLNRPTTTATVTADSGNVGDLTLTVSLTDGDGYPLDCVFAESLRATVTSDRGTGATEYSEGIQILGDAAAAEGDYNWPAGSGAGAFLSATDAAQTTLVSNGGFETWTVTDTPDDWTIDVGAATTQVQRQAAAARRGSYGVRFVSDGSTLTAIQQATSVTLTPLTVYAVTFSAKINTLSGTGTVRLSLWDDDANAVITDAQSVANSTSVGVNGGSGIDTTWKSFTAFFRTPKKVPTNTTLRLEFTTSPPSGRTVDFDLVALTQPTQLYPGGPHAVAFSNATSPVVGDAWTIAVTNSLGTSSLVRNCDRFFQTRQLGLKLPTSGSPTVSDALVA